MITFTYDRSVDAAYIEVTERPPASDGVAGTYECDFRNWTPDGVRLVHGGVNLDFDAQGHLLGIELLAASRILPPEVFHS